MSFFMNNHTTKNNDITILRHSAAHLLAQAIMRLFPKTLLTIGPATQEGFFYDVLPEHNFKEEHLELLSQEMKKIVLENYSIEHREINKTEAREIFAHNRFKLELIDTIPGDFVGIATQGEFVDLCKGGHVKSTGEIANFILLSISGSYWRADRNNQALQRISGAVFFTKEDLDDFLKTQEDLIQYDHRKIGKELDLFSFQEEGVGFPFFHPKGQQILNTMTAYMRSLLYRYTYEEISTPVILKEDLWHQSGHYQHYKDFMYFCVIDEKQYAVRPMNCPGAILVYKNRPHSYRELPLKLAEFGKVHRHELSGVLHGLLRVRAFTQDDGHIFCSQDQIETVVLETIEFMMLVLKKFEFNDISIRLSTRPEKSMGTEEQWKIAVQSLLQALEKSGKTFTIFEGEGAFYGPKIEFHIKDSMNRSWQCGTIQLDFAQPENFDLTYVDHTGNHIRPVIIHRAILGSLERFFAIVLEHFKGLLPVWLSPVQVRILTITDKQKNYAESIFIELKKHKIRTEIDVSADPISGKIKNAQREKVPLMIVIGDKEAEKQCITIRQRNGAQQFNIKLETFIEEMIKENNFSN